MSSSLYLRFREFGPSDDEDRAEGLRDDRAVAEGPRSYSSSAEPSASSSDADTELRSSFSLSGSDARSLSTLVDGDSMAEGSCGSESSLSGCEERASVLGMSDGIGDRLPFVWGVREGVFGPEGTAWDTAGES